MLVLLVKSDLDVSICNIRTDGDACALYFFFFFFQAEDGIRDQPRSRGLGDVYKRQFWTTRVSNPDKLESRP